ncbi:MAG: FAD-dependent monooxygenase [Solirubrobacteraceae bacterium]
MSDAIETDVLIVGSGPAGGSAAVMLSTYGIANIVVTKYGWTANTPRAHITNQRALEIMRDLDLQEQCERDGTPNELMGDTVFCTSLAGDELARLHTWGTHPRRLADYTLASPCLHIDLPQTYFEPILVRAAAERGSRLRFNTEFLSFEQDSDGVSATVRDRLSGSTYEIRAKYLLAGDGGRSVIAEQLGLPFGGQADVAGSMNIVFRADLSSLVAHRPSVLYWIMSPGARMGGIGMGLVRMVRPWYEWLIVWGYDIAGPAPEVDVARATEIAHKLIGTDEIDVEIVSTSLWANNKLWAQRYSQDRVFAMGDAVHRHPPSNGLGSNTSVADAYNICWKLAHVLRGQAGPSLLRTYDDERVPIGEQIVKRANKSIEEFGPIFEALGLLDTEDPAQMERNMAARTQNTPAAAQQRAKLRAAIELKNYEFNAHGVELGQRYRSEAVVPDGTPEPAYDRDPELYFHATTWPGARLPHCWLEHEGRRVSSLDLAGHGRFALLTGIGGEPWVAAANEYSARTGVEIAAYVIGPGREVLDTYDDWVSLSEVAEDGCVLVRPDQHVGWRAAALPADPAAALADALARILGRSDPAPAN